MTLDDDEIREYREAEIINRRYQANLLSHPQCRDPDHPGCERCEGDELMIYEGMR
jgi:hypothetical protein